MIHTVAYYPLSLAQQYWNRKVICAHIYMYVHVILPRIGVHIFIYVHTFFSTCIGIYVHGRSATFSVQVFEAENCSSETDFTLIASSRVE